jgi:hypothetical protein
MTELDFESSQLQLITEALRAGPGSPAWRDALAAIEHSPDADEFKVLYAARERLASGRKYREVRAGAGFTRKVFDAIEQEQAAGDAKAAALPSANLIAALSGLVILAILGVVAFFVIPRSKAPDARDDLAQTYFVSTQAQANFDSELGAEWVAFGPMGVEAHSGLHPVLKDLNASAFRGGGVSYQRALPADQPMAVAASIKVPKPSENLIVQVFVTDDKAFAGESATSPHELVCQVRGSEASVWLPGGSAATQGTKTKPGQSTDIRISVNRAQAAVDVNGQRLWTGPNQLDGSRPRTVGVRFLSQGDVAQADAPVVESIRVLGAKKQ